MRVLWVHVVSPTVVVANAPLLVDLGTSASAGNNVLQLDNATGLRNPGVGICFSPPAAATLLLPARGNTFSATKTCATVAAVLTASAACTNGDVGVQLGLSTIDTLLCTQN